MSVFFGIKGFLKTAGALLASLAAAACVWVLHFSAFPEGDGNVWYLYSASSQAEIKEALSPGDLFRTTGESAVFFPDAGESAEELAKRLCDRYGAKILFSEEAGGTVSHYCYSPKLREGILLCGKKVNLHIAVRADSVALGTPVIFGGY